MSLARRPVSSCIWWWYHWNHRCYSQKEHCLHLDKRLSLLRIVLIRRPEGKRLCPPSLSQTWHLQEILKAVRFIGQMWRLPMVLGPSNVWSLISRYLAPLGWISRCSGCPLPLLWDARYLIRLGTPLGVNPDSVLPQCWFCLFGTAHGMVPCARRQSMPAQRHAE